MWLLFCAIGTVFGSVLLMVMYHVWGLSWKQIGLYLLLSWIGGTFWSAGRDMRRAERNS